jgi:hypothetical protein
MLTAAILENIWTAIQVAGKMGLWFLIVLAAVLIYGALASDWKH